MGLKLNSYYGGTLDMSPKDTAGNVTLLVPAKNGVLVRADSETGGMYAPAGTDSERPSSPQTGMARISKTTGLLEVYNGSSWG